MSGWSQRSLGVDTSASGSALAAGAGGAVDGGTVVHATAVAVQTLRRRVSGGGTAVLATALESASEAGDALGW